MDHPLWMPVPWVVFAQARQRLERLWQQDRPDR